MIKPLFVTLSLIAGLALAEAAFAGDRDRFRQRGHGRGTTVVVIPARQAGYAQYAPPVTVIQTFPAGAGRCHNNPLPRNAATGLLLPQSHYTHGYLPPSHYGVQPGFYNQGYRDGYRDGRFRSGGINIRFD